MSRSLNQTPMYLSLWNHSDVDVRSELLVLNDVEVLTEPDVLVETLCDIDSLDAVEADLLSLVESLNDVDMLVESD